MSFRGPARPTIVFIPAAQLMEIGHRFNPHTGAPPPNAPRSRLAGRHQVASNLSESCKNRSLGEDVGHPHCACTCPCGRRRGLQDRCRVAPPVVGRHPGVSSLCGFSDYRKGCRAIFVFAASGSVNGPPIDARWRGWLTASRKCSTAHKKAPRNRLVHSSSTSQSLASQSAQNASA